MVSHNLVNDGLGLGFHSHICGFRSQCLGEDGRFDGRVESLNRICYFLLNGKLVLGKLCRSTCYVRRLLSFRHFNQSCFVGTRCWRRRHAIFVLNSGLGQFGR